LLCRDSNPERVSGEKRTCRRHVRAAKSAAAAPQGRHTRKRRRSFSRTKNLLPIGVTGFFVMFGNRRFINVALFVYHRDIQTKEVLK